MEAFVIRLVIAIGLIWLGQTLLDAFKIREPGRQIIFIIVVLVALLILVGGFFSPALNLRIQ